MVTNVSVWNSADKETHRVEIGTTINQHEVLAITGCTWVKRVVEHRIETETGKQQVAATHSNCIVGQESKNQTQDSRQSEHSGKSLVLVTSLYFPWKSFKIINLFKIFRQVIINCGLLLKSVIISLFDYWPKIWWSHISFTFYRSNFR